MILSVSHIDMDGIGCQILLNHVYNGYITRKNINYDDIDLYLDLIDEYCLVNKPQKVFITDLSFTHKQLTCVNKIAKKYKDIDFIFIDHHPFEEGFSNLQMDNLSIIINDKLSATKNLYYFLSKIYNFNLKSYLNFVNKVNAYDLWETHKTQMFKEGKEMNSLFWDYRLNAFWRDFSKDCNLSVRNKRDIERLNETKEEYYIKNSKNIFATENILIAYIDNFIDELTIKYPKHIIYVNIRSYGSVSIRFRKQDNITEEQLLTLRERLLNKRKEYDVFIEDIGGHNLAIGCKLKNRDINTLIGFGRKMLDIMNNILDDIHLKG